MEDDQKMHMALTATKWINLMELFPKILNVEEDSLKMTPSEYIKQMSLTMEERHNRLVNNANKAIVVDKTYPPQFKVIPGIVVFQRFEPRSTNCLLLEIQNVGKSLLPIKMYCPNSMYFSATYRYGNPINKLAPGLSVQYEITFTPKDSRDYSHHLVITSKEFTFQVPIKAIGPRPLLDIPDQIVLNSAPVKLSTTKYIVVRNIGTATAVFNFITKSKHFQVNPSKGILPVHESIVLNVSFHSAKVQEVTESVVLALETGEKLIVTMHGSAQNIAVRLDKSSIVHEDTFVGLKRCKTVRIINNSSSALKFSWKKNKTEEEDLKIFESFRAKFEELSELEVLKDTKVVTSGLSNAEEHKASCRRILNDELRILESKELFFSHEAFTVIPESGEVWPKTSTEVMVAFEPRETGVRTAEAYLEVTGKDVRLPLRLKGTGLGPLIVLNLKTLDIDYIYLCSLHSYEVVAENRGDIPGTIEYLMEPLIFGGKVEVVPMTRHLTPGEISSFVISFTSNRQGEFTEKLYFMIKESQEKVPVILKGKIVNPTLHFDIKQLDFGTVPVGFPKVREVTLSNLSVVPVNFSLRILSDGDVPSISWEQFAQFPVKPSLPQRPKEFHIEPTESIVEPFSSKKVTVTLTPNRPGNFHTHLVVDMWDSESGAITCPIIFQTLIPTLVAEPGIITIPFCFINFPYTRFITIKNTSKVPAFFYITPAYWSPQSSITYSASVPQGIVEPRDSLKIDITIITSALGRQVYSINFLTFGYESVRELCKISCVGQGPVVTVSPNTLQWGDLPLLDRVEKTVVVANESPIPASVSLSLMKHNTPWTVEPSSMTVMVEQSVTITVSLVLNDRGKFTDTLKVNIHNGKVLQVPLSATGIGSSLIIRPKINPTYNLGPLFSQKKYEFEISVENRGNKAYGLVWSPFSEYRILANAKFMIPAEYPFKILPVKMEIQPGETKIAKLEVKNANIGPHRQTFYCFASIGVPAKELHMTSEITAEFVGPALSFDKNEMIFWYNLGSETIDRKLNDTVNIINMSVLPVNIQLVASPPFFILTDPDEYTKDIRLSLEAFEAKEISVQFMGEGNENNISKSYRGILAALFKDQSKMCSVELKGEVNYPNLLILPRSINFGYVPVGISSCLEMCLVNVSPLTVYFDIKWNSSKSKLVSHERLPPSGKSLEFSESPEQESESAVEENLTEEGELGTEKNSIEIAQNLVPPVKPFPKMPPIQISTSDIRAALFPIMRNHYNVDSELISAYKMVRSSDAEPSSSTPYNQLFDITPFYGKLEAFCSQIVLVKFHSETPVKAQVAAFVNVRSGPTEMITLNAISADIDFQLSAVELDFGKQLFCETKSKCLRIQNTASMPFAFEADAENDQACQFNDIFPLGKGVLTISPKSGTINAFEEAELTVRYHPGVPGKFLTSFRLQIAFLDPIRIKIKGFGVFPQVYASLPRPDILYISPEIGYLAVASITPDWMLTGFAIGTGMYDLSAFKPYRSRESNLDSFTEDNLVENKWEIIQYSTSIPSEIDISLAIERILAYNLVNKDNTQNATFAIYARTIPSFNVPAYNLDFGVCVIGRTVERNVTVTNFGPLTVIMYGIFDSRLKEEGIHIRLKNRNELKIGACLPFIVAFHPRKSKYKLKYEKLQSIFYFEIYHGPKIPIKIFAEVTYPYVIASMTVLGFGEVICGCCKVITLKLKNPGLVTAHWTVHTKKSTDGPVKAPPNAVEGKSMFHLNYNSGVLTPGEYCSLQASFKPEFEGSFYAFLYIRVSEGLEDLKILLLGSGMEPRLNISQRLLNFKSTLPYPNRVEKIFSVENPCPFPIEFYFPAFDEQIYEEERILRAITLYCQMKEILLPVRRPGEGLPAELVEFYHSLLDGLNAKFMEDEREKILAEREVLEENGPSLTSVEEAESLLVNPQKKKKQQQQQRKPSRSRTSVETSRPFTASNENCREPTVQTIFEKKTWPEIDEMLQDYIASIWNKEPTYDPVQAALKAVLPTPPPEEYTEGTLLIFHGAPYTNSAQLANRAAIFVNMPALNIDHIVLEEAAFGRSAVGVAARELIEQAYMEYIGVEVKKSVLPEDWQNNEEVKDEEDFDFDLEYEEVQRKFYALVALRENLLSGKGRTGQQVSAKSDGSRKAEKGGTPTARPQMNVNAPIANITEDLVLEILKFRLSLEVAEGVVIENLESVLISSPPKALISLLKAAGNIKDIVVIFLLSTYSQYTRYQLAVQAEQDIAKLKAREEILQILEEEPEEDFLNLNLNPDDAYAIRQIFLANRHEENTLYQKKKNLFYEIEHLKKTAIKQGLPVPPLPLNVQFDSPPATDKKEKDNAKKKETVKPSKTSEVSNRMTGSEVKSARLKRDAMEGEFLSFEMDFIEMRAVIDSWDQRLGALVIESETKTKKGHSPRKVESFPTAKPKAARGVFLWLVDVSNPVTNSFSACCCYLKTCLGNRAHLPTESINWPLLNVDAMTFSVATAPTSSPRTPLNNTFVISATDNVIDPRLMGEDLYEDLGEYAPPAPPTVNTKLNRSLSSISFRSKRKGSTPSKRRRTDSRMGSVIRSLRSRRTSSSYATNESQLKPRYILQPGEMQSYRVRYFPTETGEWEQVYHFHFVNWHKGDSVRCIGICDIPHIDMKPEVMFPAVEHSKPLTTTFAPAYYYLEDAYDFGSIITLQSPEGKKTTKSVTLTLANHSTLPVDLCILLAENGSPDDPPSSEHIYFEPDKFWLTPSQEKKLQVIASPAKNGPLLESLLLIVKDNPKVDRIKVKCEGVRANVTVEPKIVNFDRLLLHRKDFRKAVLTNHNTTPLFVSLKGIDCLPAQFTFCQKNGWIPPLGSLTVEIQYNATEVQMINNHPITVQVFDNSEAEEPAQELTFNINVEAYDAALDIIFASSDDDHIDFGDIRVENNYSISFNLRNAGKYPLGYKIDMDTENCPDMEENSFYVTPQDGKLFPGKLYPVVANFLAREEVCWKRMPLFKVMLVEPYFGDELIATIPVAVSVRSHFSKYEIKPTNEFNFGHLRVGSVTTRSILIYNRGHFQLSYYIEFLSMNYVEESVETVKRSSKLSASSKDKGEKGKKSHGSFKSGVFDVSPHSGTAESGHTAVVNVSCCPNDVKRFEERIIIYVNESLPHLKKGNPITISAEGCLPIVRFDDFKAIFREHFVCKTEADLKSRIKPGTYTVYTEEGNVFSFKNVCVNKTVEARLHLQNSGLIDCVVTATVQLQGEDDGSCYFSVSPEKLIIEPYNSGCLVVKFRPEALEVYRGRLTMKLEVPDPGREVVEVLNLWGNGILPQIEITEPKSKLVEGQTLVNFPPTSAGHCSVSTVAFANTGVLECKVIIELYKFQNGVFTMSPKPSTEKMLKIWELAKPIDHTAVVSLSPGDVAEFDITFTPSEVQSYSSQIKLFIIDNPFENWSFKLFGEVFFEEVVIEKVRTALPFLAEHHEDKSPATLSPGQYFVNFRDCYVKKTSKLLLRLSNKTDKEYFKFEWDEVQSISVSPLNGHLYPNAYKEILFVFHPEEPMELEDVTIACMLNKIVLENPSEPSWDSRLVPCHKQLRTESTISPRSYDKKDSSICPGSDQVEGGSEEPLYEVVPESNRMLYVNVSGIADYAKLVCETTKIVFKNTFMFQTRIHPLVLENPGSVAVDYKLTLQSVTVRTLRDQQILQPGKNSLSNPFRPNTRPHTSLHLSSSDDSYQRPPLPHSRCSSRPRPLTAASLLDLSDNSPIPAPEQPLPEHPSNSYNPFTIQNVSGHILPKEKVSCNLVFSPMDINEYKAVVSIRVANLHPECSLPDIEILASSVMPYCHFDIAESDYLESGRRDHTRPGPIGYAPGIPLHPDTKVIEVKVLGVGVTVPIKFHVINPTEDDYSFSWMNISQSQPEVVPSLHCSTVDGRIRAGRQQLMVFTFVSQKVGVAESFWKFAIPKYGVETTFLFVSDVREPAVYFLSGHLNLRPTFIGSDSSEVLTLMNNEDVAFDFHFLQESLYSEGKLNCLRVEPSSGRIPPNSETSVRLYFTGKTPGKTIFNVKCKVKTFKEPFVVTVEAITYANRPLIAFEDHYKIKHFPDASKDNIIDFGSELNPNIPETITFNFTSLSKTSFYYEWEYCRELLDSLHCRLRFSVRNGHVKSFSRGKCDVTIVFGKKSSLVNFPLRLKIRRGPTFRFLINASASVPPFEFSFTTHDFGYCFPQEKDICYYQTPLIIKNKDSSDLFLECYLPETDNFSFFLPQTSIPPGEEILILLSFHPRDCIPYDTTLTFTVNGIYQKLVNLKGHGTEFKVGLADPRDTTISLGAIKVGKSSTREFALVNRSLAPATLLLGFSDQLPVRGMYLARTKEYPLDLSEDHRMSGVLTIWPPSVFRIKPQGEMKVRVTYTPSERCAPFSETVSLQWQEKVEPLCIVTGCCLGPEISLDRTFLNFGAIVESCTSTLKLKIVNSGSIGARFQWDTSQLSEYNISPVRGYCSPESDVTISVTFAPSAIENCIRKTVQCLLYLSENDTYPPLHLDLVGDCVAFPEPSQTLSFECVVRETDRKTLQIDNPSGTEWQLFPVISGEYFSGYDALVIPPLSSSQFEITYQPLMMTPEKHFHEGSVFFRLPNGRGLLFKLNGVALPPNPEEVIEREVPCKTKYVELLKVRNWLQCPQRFRVNISCVDNRDDPVCSCTGFEQLEVPGQAQKEYSLNFFAYNMGYLRFQVTFVNDETREYLWYDVGFHVVMCGPLELITLKSGVRQTCHYELKLENPLKTELQYHLDSTTSEIFFQNDLCIVPPLQSVFTTISFTPLHPGERTEKLTVFCDQLGIFPRDLRLIAVEVMPDPPRTFETPLGTSQTQEFLVTNLSPSTALLRCRTNCEDFTVAEQANVAAGQSVNIEVTYEPSDIGTSSGSLFVESEQAGNFVFLLLGISGKPLAKGPYTLKTGSGASIPFKNVFKKAKEFHMFVDNPAFYLRSSEETLSAKEECKICVGLQRIKCLEKLPELCESEIDQRFPVMGQLVVECFNPYVKWQFYLKGIFEK